MRSAILFATLILCACGPSLQPSDEAAVTLRVEPESVQTGDSITLILENQSAADVGYNLCASSLEQRVDGTWQPVPSDRVCTMELRTLAPGGEAEFPLAIPTDLASGEYRYVTNVEMMAAGDRGPVRSEAFRVTS